MRIFIGIPIPDSVRSKIWDCADAIKMQNETAAKAVSNFRWVDSRCYHITLLFIGEAQPEKVARIRKKIREIELPPAFRVDLGPIGRFPPRKGPPRVLFAALKSGAEGCISIYRKVSIDFEEFAERKEFVPHITLARAKKRTARTARSESRTSGSATGSTNALPIEQLFSGRFDVTRIVLYESKLGSDGPRYREIESYDLALRGEL